MSSIALNIELKPTINNSEFNRLIADVADKLNKLGINTGIDKAFIDANKYVDEFNDKLKESEESSKGLGDGLGGASEKAGLLTKAFNFNQVVQGVQAFSGAINELTAPLISLDTQVKNIGTLGVQGFEEFRDLALDLSKSVPDSAATIAQGAYNAISAGITGTNQEIIKFVETASKVAVAGVSDTNSAVNGLTSVLNAYKLSASDAGTVSDTFFAGIKLGKTSFNELNAGLANVIPAASAAKISFAEVTGVISQMTALGVPTAQATTQIRAAIIELQKPGAELSKVMGNVVVDIDGVQQKLNSSNIGKVLEQQGLTKTLQQIEQSATGMGKSLTQVFSSSEASSAALLTTGDNAQRMNDVLKSVANEIENGAASAAYEVASTGIEARTKVLVNNVQAFFAGVAGAAGDTFVVLTQTATQITPLITTFAGLATIFPTQKVGEFASSLLSKLVPSLFTSSGAFVGLGAVASSAWTAVTGPVGLIILGLGAVAGSIYALYKNFESVKEIVDNVFGAISAGASAIAGFFGFGEQAGLSFSQGFQNELDNIQVEKLKENIEKQLKTGEEIEANIKANIDVENAVSELEKINDEISKLSAKQATEGLSDTEINKLNQLKEKALDTQNQIGKLAPSIRDNVRMVVDENGNLKEVYDININKVKEFASATKKSLEGDAKKASEEYSKSVISQSNIYDRQKENLKKLADEITKTNDPNKVKELTNQYNIQKAKVDELGSSLIDNFQKGAKSALLTDESILKISKSLNISESQLRKNLFSDALKEASKQGTLTQESVEGIADKFKYSKEEAIKLWQEQEKQKQLADDTAKAAKSIGDSFADATKELKEKFNKGLSEQIGLEYEIQQARKNGNKEAVKTLTEKLNLIKQENKELDKDLDNRKKVTDAVNKQYEEQKAKSVDLFAIEKKKFETTNQLAEREIRLTKLETERLRISQGRALTTSDELNILKLQEASLKSQLERANALVKSAGNNKEKQAESLKIIEDTQLKLKELENTELKLNTKLEFEDREIVELQDKIAQKEVEMQVELGLKPRSTLLLSQIAQLQSEIERTSQLIIQAEANFDDKKALELKDKLNKLNFDLAKNQKELDKQRDDERINSITNIYEKEREIALREAKQQLNERLKIVKGNSELEIKERLIYERSLFNIQKKYIDDTADYRTKSIKSLTESLQNSFSNLDLTGNSQQSEESKKNIEAIRKERDELDKSLRGSLISRDDYFKKIQELNNREKEEQQKLNDSKISLFGAFQQGILKASEDYNKQIKESVQQLNNELIANNQLKYNLEMEAQDLLLQKQIAINEARLEDAEKFQKEYESKINSKEQLEKESADKTAEVYNKVSQQTISSLASTLVQGELTAKGMAKIALDALDSLIPIFVAQIFGGMASSPNPANTFSLGAVGLAQAGLLTGVLKGLVAVAKASFWTGGKLEPGLLSGGRNQVLVEYNELGPEFFVNHKATAKNLEHLEYINKHNISIEEYSLRNDKIKNVVINDYLRNANFDKLQNNRVVVMQDTINTDKMNKVLDRLEKLQKNGNTSEINMKADFKMEFDHDEFIKKNEVKIFRKIRRK